MVHMHPAPRLAIQTDAGHTAIERRADVQVLRDAKWPEEFPFRDELFARYDETPGATPPGCTLHRAAHALATEQRFPMQHATDQPRAPHRLHNAHIWPRPAQA